MDERTIWQKMFSEYNKWQQTDAHQAFTKMISSGTATYESAQEYAKCVAKKWSDLLKKYVGADADLSGIPEEQVVEAIETALTRCYKSSSFYSKQVQELINESLNLNIKALEGNIDPTRISHLLKRLKDGEDVFDEMLITPENEWLIDEPIVENVSRSAITDTIQANALLHGEAGLIPYIERRPGAGKCCDWCSSISGRYVYGEEPKDFFRVHKNCNCVITYMPSRGRWQEITYSTNKKGIRSKNTVDL